MDNVPVLFVALKGENEVGGPSRHEEGNEVETIVTGEERVLFVRGSR